jgi:predicted O-methyltransferase YrrM
MHPFIQRMLTEQKTIDQSGAERRISGSIAPWEAEFFQGIIARLEPKYCLETGIAYGVSTAVICEGLSKLGGERKLWGVDPCQITEFGGAALAALEQCGTRELFELLEGPSHIMLPKLLEQSVKLDLVFIDGWHTFDYTLIDLFYGDKMLRPGGMMLLHDHRMKSKQKVGRFLASHRRYRFLPGPTRPPSRSILTAGKNTLLLRPRLALDAWAEFLGRSNLLVAEKLEDYEPPFNFFRDF